jgi:NAD(P)-dependent dehydrogenase (short-subunit alcohol dehydrogenase family)
MEAVKRLGGNAIYLPLDISSEHSISKFSELLLDHDLSPAVLINNAGILQDQSYTLLDVPLDNFDQTMNINFRGPLLLMRALVPFLRKHKDARIINMSSGLGALSSIGGGYPGYRVSKAALNAMTAVLAHDLAGDGIKVNCMSPGWVRTEMGGPAATRDVQKGAETAVWLATAPDIPNGKFLRDKEEIDW